jgi:hypothetical protein
MRIIQGSPLLDGIHLAGIAHLVSFSASRKIFSPDWSIVGAYAEPLFSAAAALNFKLERFV